MNSAETKFGDVPLTCIKLSKNAQTKELIFLQRHHNNGKPNKPPHNINHKANISALNDQIVKRSFPYARLVQLQSVYHPEKWYWQTNT